MRLLNLDAAKLHSTVFVCMLVGALATMAAQAAVVVHRYDFESQNGDDSVGTVDGVVQGAPAFPGSAPSGSHALALDGSQYVDFPNPMDFGDQFSIAAWIKPTSALGIQTILANAQGGWGTDGFKLFYNSWTAEPSADRKLAFETGNGVDGAWYGTDAAVAVPDIWLHVVATVDVPLGQVNYYVDGVPQAGAWGVRTDFNTNFDWEIGRMPERAGIGGAWGMSGALDDVQIYSGVVTAEEADWLATNPGLALGDTAATLTWDEQGTDNWNSASWVGGSFPDKKTHAALGPNNPDTVMVTAPAAALTLTVGRGAIAVQPSQSLEVVADASFATGTTLSLGGATFAAGGGSLARLKTAGNATVDVGGDVSVTIFGDGGLPGTFTKAGIGTLSLDNDANSAGTVTAAATTLQINGGTLSSRGNDPLGGATEVILGGGTLSVSNTTITHRYDFENDNGDDSVGDLNGIVQGDPVFSNDRMSGDRAIILDADYLDFPDPMEFGRQFSVAVWVKPDLGAPGQIQTLLANTVGGSADGFKLFYNTYNTGDGRLILETGNGAAFAGTNSVDLGVITPDAWNHVVATVDMDAGAIRFFVDGAEIAGEGTVVGDANTNSDWEIGRMEGGFNLIGRLDDVQIYSGTLTDADVSSLFSNPGSAIEASMNLGGTHVRVTADSGLEAFSGSTGTTFGSLTMNAGVLTTAGSGGIAFAGGTTIPGGADVGFNTLVNTTPGAIDANSAGVTIGKSGPADLILDKAGIGLDGATFDVQQGRLAVYGGPNPLGTAGIELSGGELLLSASPGDASPVVYDNPVVVTQSSTLTAGAGDRGAAAPMTVTLGSVDTGHGVELRNGTLTIRSTDDYLFHVPAVSGTGDLSVPEGHVVFSAEGNSVGNMAISGGTVDTGEHDVSVAATLTLGETNFQTTPGNAFQVSGSDLANDAVPRSFTLHGGTFSVVNTRATHRYDFEDDTAGDSVGSVDGAVVGDAAFTDDAASGSRSISLDGVGDYIDFTEAMDFGRQFTIAAWVKPDPAMPAQIQTIVANGPGGTADGFKFFYNRYNSDDRAIVVETANGAALAGNAAGTIVDDLWNHVVATLDFDAGEVRVYLDGVEQLGDGGGMLTDAATNSDWEIGRMEGAYDLMGLIDDVQIYPFVVTAEEAGSLYDNPGSVLQGTFDLSETSLVVTADTVVTTPGAELVLADLIVEFDTSSLTLDGAVYSFQDATIADGVTIDGQWSVEGSLSIGNSPGTMTIGDGELVLATGSTTNVEVSLAVVNPIEADGSTKLAIDRIVMADGSSALQIGGTLAISNLGDRTDAGYWAASPVIIDNPAQGPIGDVDTGTMFDAVTPAPPGPGEPALHLGQGLFLLAGTGVTYDSPFQGIIKAVELDVLVALGGDADGDGKVWLADWAALRANFGNTGTGKTWTEGNFDPWVDEKVWLSDWAALRANFGNSDYTATEDGAAAVPEPGTIAMLLGLLAGLALAARRRR